MTLNIVNNFQIFPLQKINPATLEDKLQALSKDCALVRALEKDKTISTPVKWQIFHAAKAFLGYKKQVNDEFGINHLSATDLYSLYEFFNLYLESCSENSWDFIMSEVHLVIIENYFMDLCMNQPEKAIALINLMKSNSGLRCKTLYNKMVEKSTGKGDVDQLLKTFTLNHPFSTNGQVINFSFAWYNLSNDPQFKIQPSEKVKWQILNAAKGNIIEEIVKLDPSFQVAHLSMDEISLLYQIFNSNLLNLQRDTLPYLIMQKHLNFIEERVFNLCFENLPDLENLLKLLEDQEIPHFNGIIYRIKITIEFFHLLNVDDKKMAALNFMQNYYANVDQFQYNEREVKFYYFLKVLDKFLPNLQIFHYFFDFGLGSNTALAPDVAGLELLTDFFNKKAKYLNRLDSVRVICLDQLTNYLNFLELDKFKGERKIILLNKGQEGGHYTAIFLKRTELKGESIIVDSANFDSKLGWISMIKNALDKTIFKLSEPIAFDPPRQSDGLSCSITTFRDILESAKLDLFEFVEQTSNDKIRYSRGFKVISHFPPQFMKVKQSLSYLNNYESEVPESKNAIVASKIVQENGVQKQVNKTLREVVEAHTTTIDGYKSNFYLRKRAFKYFISILTHLLNNQEIK